MDWYKWLDNYIHEINLRKHKGFVAIVIILLVYVMGAKFLNTIKPAWIPEQILIFLQVDVLDIFIQLFKLLIYLTIWTFLLSMLSLISKLKEPFIRKVTLMNGCPIWVCYKYEAKEKMGNEAVRKFLDGIYSRYKKKRIMIFGEYPECYIVYGTANKTAIDTSGKRKDAKITEYLRLRLKNMGTQCVKVSIENIKINDDLVEIMDTPVLLCDLSKEKQEYIISINEICSNEEDFRNKLVSAEQTTLLLDIISYDLYKNKYSQTLMLSKNSGKWEFFIVDMKQI